MIILDATRIRNAVSLIAVGLYDTERQAEKTPNKYPVSPFLQKGMNIFLADRYFVGNVQSHEHSDIYSFCKHYLSAPLCEWFSDWDPSIQAKIKDRLPMIWSLDALALEMGNNRYECSEECLDLVNILETDNIIESTEQRMVYDELRQLSQNDYTRIRRFIIEHPEATISEYQSLFRSYIKNDHAKKALDNAYKACDALYVLHPGVKRYMADPGVYEIELSQFCDNLGLEWELWPRLDKYDLAIHFKNGKYWTLDVKAYKNAYILQDKIRADGGYPRDEKFDEGFIVVPNDKIKASKQKEHYTRIINNNCFADEPNVSCVKLSEIKRAIKKEAGNHE